MGKLKLKLVMKKLVLSIIPALFIVFNSCNNDNSQSEENKLSDSIDNQLDFAMGEKYQTLDPIKIADVPSFVLGHQIYECLLRLDNKDLSIKPMIAESWDISEDGLTYTFKIKKGVFFHDNDCFKEGKGRELKASDVVYSFKRICSKSPGNYAHKLFKDKIIGAKSFYNSEKGLEEKELDGVKALDDYTIEFKLNSVSSSFLNSLAIVSGSIVAKEAIEKDRIAGSGPFVYDPDNDSENKIVLHRNPNYHVTDSEGNQLPYIDAVSYKYISSAQESLDAFIAGELDAIGSIPPNTVKKFVEEQISSFQSTPAKYILTRNKRLMTSYLTLNTTLKPLNNKKVRQAIAMAIDKKRIVDGVLKGEAYGTADYGIVPPFMKDYNYSSVVGLEHNVKKAQELLAEAGYKAGKGFPKLIFTTNGKNNTSLRIALEIQKQLSSNLNVNLEISSASLAESMKMNANGKGNISLSGWLADYPDPANFLSLAYGGYVPESIDEPSFPNTSRYINPDFDQLYEKILKTLDDKKRNELSATADQIIANDVPIIPLWYQEKYGLIQSVVKNYYPNPMGVLYLANVKIENTPSTEKK